MTIEQGWSPRYRADIDGLRAIAVLAVVAFHSGFERLAPGGFVGVDIFFVISGFLITKIIYHDIDRKTYSVARFYTRRALRILPALSVMFLACWICGVFIYFPAELHHLSTSLIAASLFVSNVNLYFTSNYFAQSADINPVLHTWSLAVEEQFYILFPVVVWSLKRLSVQNRRIALAGLTVLSLVAASVMVHVDSSAAFYLVQYRAWELLMGALLSVEAVPAIRNSIVAEGVGIVGLLLIAGAMLMLDKTSLFPGLSALAPCVGAAALIHAGTDRQTVASRLLGLAPLRFIGLISYSLYLWHWPVIVFGSLLHQPRGVLDKATLVVISIVLAAASWRFVERPFRRHDLRSTSTRTLSLSAAVVGLTCAFALMLNGVGASLWSFPKLASSYLALADYDPNAGFRVGSCFLTSEYSRFDMFKKDECLHLSKERKNVLILGDSHAADLRVGYDDVFSDVNIMQATASGCRPVLPLSGEKRCVDLDSFVMNDFLKQHRVDEVVLSGRWELADVQKALATASFLRPLVGHVIVSGPAVEYSQPLPRILASAAARGLDLETYAAQFRRVEPREVDDAFKRQVWPEGVSYVSLYSAMCAKACLALANDGLPIQFDYGHFTKAGSDDVAALVETDILRNVTP